MKRRFRVQWSHEDEAVVQLMSMNAILLDILGELQEINNQSQLLGHLEAIQDYQSDMLAVNEAILVQVEAMRNGVDAISAHTEHE
jgi:predicted transcriptional regulator